MNFIIEVVVTDRFHYIYIFGFAEHAADLISYRQEYVDIQVNDYHSPALCAGRIYGEPFCGRLTSLLRPPVPLLRFVYQSLISCTESCCE